MNPASTITLSLRDRAYYFDGLMKLSQAYGPGKFGLSFELFPPKTPAGELEMFRHLEQLMAFSPSYVTCTYGAGGSTRAKTLEIVEQVRLRFRCPVASHL